MVTAASDFAFGATVYLISGKGPGTRVVPVRRQDKQVLDASTGSKALLCLNWVASQTSLCLTLLIWRIWGVYGTDQPLHTSSELMPAKC